MKMSYRNARKFENLSFERWVVWFGLMWVVLFSLGECGGGFCFAKEILSFEDFMQVNQQNYNIIDKGRLELYYTEYFSYTQSQIDMKLDRAEDFWQEKREEIEADENLTKSEKEERLLWVDKVFKPDLEDFAAEEVTYMKRSYTFDMLGEDYRFEKRPADPNDAISYMERATINNVKRAVIVSSNGIDLRYYPEQEEAFPPSAHLGDYGNAVANGLPVHIGTVRPRDLQEWVQRGSELKFLQAQLGQHDVVVYQLTMQESDSGEGMLKIYADPAVGYRIRRVELINDGSVLRAEIAKDYKIFNDIPLPTYYQRTDYRDGAEQSIAKQTTIQVEAAELNVPVDPNRFKVSFDTDTLVVTRSKGQFMLYVESEKKRDFSVDEMLALADVYASREAVDIGRPKNK